MAAVLGISGLYHDAAAALVVDGEVVAAIHEERLSRVKHTSALPIRAAFACMRQAGIAVGDLDSVVFYEQPFVKLERVLLWLLRTFPRAPRYFAHALRQQLSSKLWVLDALSEQLGVARQRVRAVSHHASHAASAFFVSPHERAAVLTVDGVGEHVTTAIWKGDGRRIACCWELEFPHSVGLFYAGMTAYLGFPVLGGELRLMALAALGKPRFVEELRKLLRLHSDGSFELVPRYFDSFTNDELGFSRELEKLLGPARPYGRRWDLQSSEADQRYADLAASTQALTEEALLGLARRAKRETGLDALCLAGGVALNCAANARIARDAGFDRVFVQPAAGDAGGALGAAILVALELGDPRPAALRTAALGQAIEPAEARTLADALGLVARRVDDPAAEIARRLERGQIVGVAYGRAEWGPRALGHRSLLAPAHDARFRHRINRSIKRREPFRPFAPSVLSEHAAAWFDSAPNDMTPFMTTTCAVRAAAQEGLAAVVHADGSSRLHTVTPEASPLLAETLRQYQPEGGFAAVLNTSLNGAGEPIVGSAADALAFYTKHRAVDALVIDDMLVVRNA
jgi:carbamoyltransferase